MTDFLISIPRHFLILLINIYRHTLSPLFGNQCRFYPTCSHYAEDAIKQHGAYRGSIIATKRIFRCHPWHEGGYDPVPDKKEKDHSGELNLG
jgi:putative membrane protein insertion efficiency factor